MKSKDAEKIRQESRLAAGLYLVGTPIGNLDDITMRALKTLKGADRIYAEDTRVTARLLDLLGIKLEGRPLRACHDHNEAHNATAIVEQIEAGEAVAYVSDAGMPLVSDPGYHLVQAVTAAGLDLTIVPGPSAVTTAIALSGLPSDRFAFLGFLPSKSGKRQNMLRDDDKLALTRIYFESPHRIYECIGDIVATLGGERDIVIARELTKTYEEAIRGQAAEVYAGLAERSPLKGEIVLMIAPATYAINDIDVEGILKDALDKMSLRDAVDHVTKISGEKRKIIYQKALAIAK